MKLYCCRFSEKEKLIQFIKDQDLHADNIQSMITIRNIIELWYWK